MSHVIALPDDIYQAIAAYAAQSGQSPEAFILAWAAEIKEKVNAFPGFKPSELEPTYDPKDDPLAEFLGIGEITSPDAIDRHDEAFAEEKSDARQV